MSRNEGEEEEGLFVWTVFFSEKAYSLSRLTVVREGMSVCEDRVNGSTLQSDGTRIMECIGCFDINVSTCLFHTQGPFLDSIVTCKYYLGYSSDFNKQRYD